jgi:hypothetical protein
MALKVMALCVPVVASALPADSAVTARQPAIAALNAVPSAAYRFLTAGPFADGNFMRRLPVSW